MILLKLCIAGICAMPQQVSYVAFDSGSAIYADTQQYLCTGHVVFAYDGTATIAADRCEGFIFRNGFGD